MVSCRQYLLRCFGTTAAIALLLVLTTARDASAQEEEQSSALADVVKGVVFDPTTYAPALISYDATMRDWNTSQPFFRNGYLERNARFTISGRPNDAPVSYTIGRNRIFKDTMTTFATSAAQNLSSRLVERALLTKYPEHRKIVKTIGWIQRVGTAALISYHLSAAHYRQAGLNAAAAREFGYR